MAPGAVAEVEQGEDGASKRAIRRRLPVSGGIIACLPLQRVGDGDRLEAARAQAVDDQRQRGGGRCGLASCARTMCPPTAAFERVVTVAGTPDAASRWCRGGRRRRSSRAG
jgi:hypothetical protein